LDWLIGGLLYDHLSVVTTSYIALAIGIIGAFIMILGIRDKERQTDQKRSDMI
jgi:predicted MFS family arabinose efflux permease